MPKILITGGGGFIGFQLAKLLSNSAENELHLVDDFSKAPRDEEFDNFIQKKSNCCLIEGDLCKPSFYKDLGMEYDQIYHLAAKVGVKYADKAPDVVIRVNSLSTIHLLEWIRENRSKLNSNLRILFASSSENYAGTVSSFSYRIPTPETVPLCIDDPRTPRWSYAATKILGEVAFIQYGRKLHIPTKIIRYHNIYGPRMGTSHVIPEFILRILRREDPFQIFGGNQCRSFCYVTDAVEMTMKIMNHSSPQAIFNVGSDRSQILILDIAQMLFNLSGFHPTIIEKHAPRGSVNRRAADMSLAKSLGLFRQNVQFKEGLEATYNWYVRRFLGDAEKYGE